MKPVSKDTFGSQGKTTTDKTGTTAGTSNLGKSSTLGGQNQSGQRPLDQTNQTKRTPGAGTPGWDQKQPSGGIGTHGGATGGATTGTTKTGFNKDNKDKSQR